MNLFFLRDCFGRCLERKQTILLFSAIFLLGALLGICFVKTPAVYDYHLNICERFLVRICFSDRDVFVIFLERVCGCAILLALMIFAGMHLVGLVIPPAVLLYRAYIFGGSVAIFFSVYRVTGVLVVFVLYMPIHLLIDIVLIAATVVSCGRAPVFRFCKSDFCELGFDFLACFLVIVAACFLEMLLLLAIFHPIGTII